MATPQPKHYIVAVAPEYGFAAEPQHITATTTKEAVDIALDTWIYRDYEFTADDVDGIEVWVAEAKNFTIHLVETSARWNIDDGKKATA